MVRSACQESQPSPDEGASAHRKLLVPGAYDGLGTIMNAMQANLKTAALMAAIMACTLLGILLFLFVQFLGAVVLRKWTRDAGFEAP